MARGRPTDAVPGQDPATGNLLVMCWCGGTDLWVSPADVLRGRTGSCSEPCKPGVPLVRRREGHNRGGRRKVATIDAMGVGAMSADDIPVRINYDPDIGRCDDCGTEEGRRRRTLRTVTVNGKPERVAAWLCPSCRGAALARWDER